MPVEQKYFTDAERKEGHRVAALKYARKTAEKHRINNLKRYHDNNSILYNQV